MRPISHQVYTALPAILSVVLVLLSAAPLDGDGISLTPNIAWLMTLVIVTFYPPAWPRGFAFALGLLQDVLFGTPLGSQALLALLLAQVAGVQARRQQTQLFRMRWMEAACMLILWHLGLWLLIHLVQKDGASVHGLLFAGMANAFWYPVFYGLGKRLLSRNLSAQNW